MWLGDGAFTATCALFDLGDLAVDLVEEKNNLRQNERNYVDWIAVRRAKRGGLYRGFVPTHVGFVPTLWGS